MKKGLFFLLTLIFIFSTVSVNKTYAYSYGDPGEEQLAEAYKELDKYLQQDDWDNALAVYNTYQKEFDLYFTKTKAPIEAGFEEKNKELVLKSYQYAMLLNIERRLHFAEEQFDDYGQAKLLLAKARGTFNVLEPILVEKADQQTADEIYKAFDEALTSLGNPGLFGIGSKSNDSAAFTEKTTFILTELQKHFQLPTEEKDESHLTEDNLGFLDGKGEKGSSSFWLIFTVGLLVVFVGLIAFNKMKKKKDR
ncbi:hypothetical protein J2S09_003409 [Bacillus fengqiuensis]|nr:hypothetical protein [Bacillus fengqiuensis]